MTTTRQMNGILRRIEKANEWIAIAQDRDITGRGYFGSTWPVSIEYTTPIKVDKRRKVAIVEYVDGGKKTIEEYDLKLSDEYDSFGIEDLKHEIKTYIIKAIKNGADDMGITL